MPARSFSHTAQITVPIERAWEALQQPSTWAGIGGVEEISDATHDQDGALVSYRFVTTVGGSRYRGRAETTRVDPPETMTMRIHTDHLIGTIHVDLAREAITVTVTVEPKGLLATMAFPSIAASVGSGLPRNVETFTANLT